LGARCVPGARRERGYEAAATACTRGPTQGLGAKGTRGEHVEHVAHVRDAGGVEAQRLVEGRCALPSRREGMRCGGERREPEGGRARGGGGTQEACTGKARLKAWGPRARAERTPNMLYMVVTLEVLKLSGWLKADASCRVEGRGHAMRGDRYEPGGGRACWGGGGTQEACTGKRPDSRPVGAKGTRGAHSEHVAHVCDAGGVEAQRLWLKPTRPAESKGGHAMRGGRGASREAGGPVVWWRHDKRHARGKGPTQGLRAEGTRGAHVEHVAHGRDAGGVEAQRLVEGRRALKN